MKKTYKKKQPVLFLNNLTKKIIIADLDLCAFVIVSFVCFRCEIRIMNLVVGDLTTNKGFFFRRIMELLYESKLHFFSFIINLQGMLMSFKC